MYKTEPFQEEGSSASFTVEASGGPLVVVLAWMDLPSTPGTEDVLIQDLDLRVRRHPRNLETLIRARGQGQRNSLGQELALLQCSVQGKA